MRLTESEMLKQLEPGTNKFFPIEIKSVVSGDNNAEAFVEFFIADGPSFKAFVEIMPVATPKIISPMVQFFRGLNDKEKIPLLVVPYMRDEQAKILQKEGISWIDLCGNMTIRAPGGIYIERTGNKNQFPDTSPIKKIFEGTSSLVSRALLLKKEPFKTLYEIVNFINERNGNITLATVSKVIRSLEEDVLVTKADNGISVTNREKLLDKLAEGYTDYTKRNKNSVYTFSADVSSNITKLLFDRNVTYAACGFYAAKIKNIATTDRINIIVQSINEAKKAFENQPEKVRPDSEFGQIDIIETKNPCVWFNLQGITMSCIVDDLELYLEMMIDTPRGPKVAEMLKERILQGQI